MSAEIALVPMTRELIHRLYREFENDPDIYADMQYYTKYVYNQQAVDRRFDALQGPERVVFAILHGGAPIGELQLKRINRERGDCTLSIHMQNDKVKNRGFGTEAEKARDSICIRRIKARRGERRRNFEKHAQPARAGKSRIYLLPRRRNLQVLSGREYITSYIFSSSTGVTRGYASFSGSESKSFASSISLSGSTPSALTSAKKTAPLAKPNAS